MGSTQSEDSIYIASHALSKPFQLREIRIPVQIHVEEVSWTSAAIHSAERNYHARSQDVTSQESQRPRRDQQRREGERSAMTSFLCGDNMYLSANGGSAIGSRLAGRGRPVWLSLAAALVWANCISECSTSGSSSLAWPICMYSVWSIAAGYLRMLLKSSPDHHITWLSDILSAAHRLGASDMKVAIVRFYYEQDYRMSNVNLT